MNRRNFDLERVVRISRASLEESTRNALATHQDVKSPDEPHYLHQLSLSSKEALQRINDLPDGFLDNLKDKTLIDKDLLQRIYDQIAFIAWDKAHSGCEDLQKELDSLYPYLSC